VYGLKTHRLWATISMRYRLRKIKSFSLPGVKSDGPRSLILREERPHQDYFTGDCARVLASRTQLSDSTSLRTLWLCRRPHFTLTNEHVWPPHPALVAYALISTSVRSTLLEMESLLLSKFGYRRLEVAKCCNCKSATRSLITKHV
jgi:hypothetical protein